MIGTAMVLPFMGYYAQTGDLSQFNWLVIASIVPTHLACGMSTSLPDEPSDRADMRNTSSVLFGVSCNKFLIIILNVTGLVVFMMLNPLGQSLYTLIAICVVPLLGTGTMIAFFSGKPGTKSLDVFVTSAVATTLSFMAGIIIAAFIR